MTDIQAYNNAQSEQDRIICNALLGIINSHLPKAENKIWHRHPVWFLEGNPIVGYSKLKGCVRLMFWSGQSFDEDVLENEGTFKAASIRYTSVDQVDEKTLKRLLRKARKIQWDYKNIVRGRVGLRTCSERREESVEEQRRPARLMCTDGPVQRIALRFSSQGILHSRVPPHSRRSG